MNAAEDFLLLLLHAHVVAAAEVMQSVHPSDLVAELADSILENFVRSQQDINENKYEDKVFVYSMEVLSLGLHWHGLHDAVREGDGENTEILEVFSGSI